LTTILAKLLSPDSAAEHSHPGEHALLDSAREGDSITTLYLDKWPTSRLSMNLLGKNLYLDKEIRKGLTDRFAGLEVKSGIDALTYMREVKDTSELRLMRKAIDITVKGHSHAMARARSGMKEFEIEALIEFGFKSLGAEDVGYPSIVGSGYNSCILHYSTNRRKTLAGDMILADCGAEYHGYTADVTRTFPLGGRFSPDQRIIYDVVLEAQDSGIAACRAGAAFKASHIAATRVIQRRLKELNIISDSTEAKKYFMHGTSHYLGLDVHDVGMKGPLRPNTVITVEPGIYIPSGSPCDKRWWNIGVRIEDDVLVTNGDPDVLSRDLPRAAEDIERMVGSSFRSR
jgi:Xaa-Pro aminopeptidase